MAYETSMTLDAFVTMVESNLNRVFTDEQRDFIKSLDKPGICFASPGTGKTASAVAGLLVTELYKRIPGENIFALSFTNMATLELSVRHENACRALGITQRVNFKTLHSMCSQILRNNHLALGIDKYNTIKEWPMLDMAQTVYNAAKGLNMDLDPYKARTVVKTVRNLNSSLTFSQDNVESKSAFIDTGLSYDQFQYLRKLMFEFDKQMGTIEANNIMLYTLELLLEHPEISEEFKKKCRVLLVDEAQDLSLLQLRILSLLSDNLVLIGDIKQQIYAFNGACQEIVGQYYKYFPNAWSKELTQSFRCKNEIAKFATKLILPNNVGGEDFKGCGDGGIVTVEKGIDYQSICGRIADDYFSNKRSFTKGILFLFRNNLSGIPVAEEFFKLQVPFRINNYTPVTRMPVISDLCAIAELAYDPRSLEDLSALKFLLPELREYKDIRESPLYKIMQKDRCDVFSAKYKWKDSYNAERALGALLEMSDLVLRNAKVSDIFNCVYQVYAANWLKTRERFMEYDASHYINLASYVVNGKSFRQFKQDEVKKADFIKDCNERRIGVRCFTFHSAKGLEDDVVYMVDCDQGIIPNKSKLTTMLERNCLMDAAREIRNERSLVYVAATRAKSELHIHYNKELASVLTSTNTYKDLDMVYQRFIPDYSDVEVFQEFYRKELNNG